MTKVISERSFQALFEAARRVLDFGESPESLRYPLDMIEQMVAFRESRDGQEIIKRARDLYIDDACDIDVDDATCVYSNECNGHWVMSWCFVDDRHADDSEPTDEKSDEFVSVSSTPNADGRLDFKAPMSNRALK